MHGNDVKKRFQCPYLLPTGDCLSKEAGDIPGPYRWSERTNSNTRCCDSSGSLLISLLICDGRSVLILRLYTHQMVLEIARMAVVKIFLAEQWMLPVGSRVRRSSDFKRPPDRNCLQNGWHRSLPGTLLQSLGQGWWFGAIAQRSDRYFRFQCPSCSELRATVNPSNNLAHCFCCGKNFNNIDLILPQEHDFLPAVDVLANWLREYRRDQGHTKSEAESSAV